MDPQLPPKRKRGRPRKVQPPEGDNPPWAWAIVDQLTLIHDDLKEIVKMAKVMEGPAGPGMFDQVNHG